MTIKEGCKWCGSCKHTSDTCRIQHKLELVQTGVHPVDAKFALMDAKVIVMPAGIPEKSKRRLAELQDVIFKEIHVGKEEDKS
jgi:hypothetical protein